MKWDEEKIPGGSWDVETTSSWPHSLTSSASCLLYIAYPNDEKGYCKLISHLFYKPPLAPPSRYTARVQVKRCHSLVCIYATQGCPLVSWIRLWIA